MIFSKRGTSDTEMIISFGMFVTFVLFMFVYINPLKPAPSSSLATALEVALNDNATISLEKIGFAVNKTLLDKSGADCFQISNKFPAGKFFILDQNGTASDFQKAGANIIVKKTSKFYYAFIGSIDGAKSASIGCTSANTKILTETKDYSWSVPVNYTIYYNRSLNELKKAYDSDYNSLKNNLNLPSTSGFSIVVSDADMNEIIKMTKTAPNVNVIAREFPIEILSDENGIKIMKGYLRLLVW